MKRLLLFIPIMIVLFSAAQEKKENGTLIGANINSLIFNPDSSNLILKLSDAELSKITTGHYFFTKNTPLNNIHIENKTIPEYAEETIINLLLEYKQECHGLKPIKIRSWIVSSNDYESILEDYNKIKDTWEESTVELIETDGTWTTGNSHMISDGFTYLNINETKLDKYVVTITTNIKKIKTPTFEDFLNWIEERSNK